MTNKEAGNQKSNLEYYFDKKEWFKVEQVEDNVWAIREPKHEQDVVSYFIVGREKNVMIDSGMGLADIKNVLPSTDNPTNLLLSHTHWDHVGGATQFSDISVFDDPYETNRLRIGWRPREMPGFDPGSFLTQVPSDFSSDEFLIPGNPNFRTFKDGEEIELGDLTILVIHTPGHTPGSTSFFIQETGQLFTGDTLYPGPEYLHMQESNPDDYFKSIENLNNMLKGKITTIFPAHNAIKASPELLDNHVLAAKGLLPPLSIEEKEDWFNKYVEYKWKGFSFLLPRNFQFPKP